ncbi:MAG: hypothetical protein ACMG55_15745 [Microcoleus sp.]
MALGVFVGIWDWASGKLGKIQVSIEFCVNFMFDFILKYWDDRIPKAFPEPICQCSN